MYTPPVKGRFLKKKPTPQVTGDDLVSSIGAIHEAVGQIKQTESDVIDTVNFKLKEIDDTVKQGLSELTDASQTLETTKVEVLDHIKEIKQGEPGAPGRDGQDGKPADETKITKILLAKVPKEKDLVDKVIKAIPKSKASLKIIQEKFETDPMSVIEKIMAMGDKFKIKQENIDGLSQTLSAFNSQLGRGYLHGGGDTVTAGTNITLVKTADGKTQINATSGTTLELQTNGVDNGSQTLLNLVQGSNVTISDDGLGNVTIAATGTTGVVGVTGTAPIIINNTDPVNPIVTIQKADTVTDGYLSSTDWNTFNNKQNTLTIGNLSDTGTDGITVGSGTGAVIGSGTTISQHVADSTHNGYLSSTDWATFNGKQPAGTYVTSVSGTTDRITSTGGTTPVIDISASYVGQSSITTLGTIGTGTWQGTTINYAYLGSGGVGSGLRYLADDNTWKTYAAGGGTVTSVASADSSITVTNPTSTVDLAVVSSPKLTTARTIGGVSFDGTANITVATATGGFTVSGGNLTVDTTTLFVDATNHRVGIGTTSPSVVLDIVGTSIRQANSTTDATNKAFRFQTRNFTNAQNDFLLVFGQSKTSGNTLIFGGGQTGSVAASSIAFFTGTGNNTDTGTSRMAIDSTGNVSVASLTGSKVVFTDSSKNLTSTGIGTSSQFIKGDGSLDSSTYLTANQTITLSGDVTGSGTVAITTAIASSVALAGSPTTTTQTFGDSSTKIATTAFVQAAITGTTILAAAKVATTATLVGTYVNGASGVGATFTYTATGVDTIDGVALTLGMRVLVKNQSSSFQNGIYTVTTAGAIGVAGILTRATDYDQAAEVDIGDTLFVISGTAQGGTSWVQNGTENPVMGTDPITFVQTAGPGSYTAGNGLTLTGTSFSIDTSVTVDKTTVQTLTNKTLTSPVLTTPDLGTPSALVLTNASGTVTNLTLVNPALGTPASGVMTNVTGTAASLTAGHVTNATFTTALTVNTGTLTLTANAANTSVLTIGAGAVSVSGSNTGDQTSISGNAGTATALQNARTIGGVSFDGTANITVATATGGFTVSGGDLALGANNITMTGSLGATGARLTKGWFTDLQVTNAIAGSVTGNAGTVTNGVYTNVANSFSVGGQVITVADTTNVIGLKILANDTTNHPLGLQVGSNAAQVSSSTLVQFNDDTGGNYSDWAFNVSGNGYPAIALQSTGGTLASPTASSTGAKSSIDTYAYNSTPAQVLISQIWTNLDDATASSEDSTLNFSVITAGSLANKLELNGAALNPAANDDLALGTATVSFSDLFLASGAVINYANGNVVLTHTTGILTIGTGTLKITTPTNTTTSVVTIDGTQTLTNKSIVASQITAGTFATGTFTFQSNIVVGTTVDLSGSISGTSKIVAAFSGGGTGTLPAGSGTLVYTGGNVATATALQNARTLWGQSFNGTGNVSGSQTGIGDMTGGASNMTITSGTGASRTMILRTTTSGSTATTALTLGADQSATFAGTVALGSNNLTMTGSLAATGARVTKGWFTDLESTNMPTVGGTAILTSLTAPQFTTIELGAASDTTLSRVSAGQISVEGINVVTISSTDTLTNKRVNPRVVSAASYTTDTGTSLDVSTTDLFVITAQAGALKFNNPGGTPVQGQKLMIRIKDNATARALTYDTQFRASSDLALPTTTILSKTLYMGFIYNSTDTKWDLLAVLNNF